MCLTSSPQWPDRFKHFIKITIFENSIIHFDTFVKLREREGQGMDPGRSPKGHSWMVVGGYPFPDALH